MRLTVFNPHNEKQSLEGIKESFFVLPNQTIEIETSDFYAHELDRAKKFLTIKNVIQIEIIPTANVEKPKFKKFTEEV